MGQTAAGRTDGREQGILHFDYNGRDIFMPWREPALPDGTLGTPLVEQIRIAGLSGNDRIEFRQGDGLDNGGLPVEKLDLADLIARSDDYVGVLDGGPGNDTLLGSEARDRIDGGNGSDVIYGFGGDDRLWGNSGTTGSPSEHDVIFGGQGADDLIGGPGENQLFAWTLRPEPHHHATAPAEGPDGRRHRDHGGEAQGYAAAPDDGRLRADMHFALQLNDGDEVPIDVLAAETAGFTTLDQLVALINAQLAASPLDGLVQAGTLPSGGQELTSPCLRPPTAPTLALRVLQFGVYVGDDGVLRSDNGDLDGDGLNDDDGTSVLYAQGSRRDWTACSVRKRTTSCTAARPSASSSATAATTSCSAPTAASSSRWTAACWARSGSSTLARPARCGTSAARGADDVITVDYVTEPGLLPTSTSSRG